MIGALNGEGYLTETIYDEAGQKVRELAYANATPAPKPVRSRPSLLSRETPSYPPSAIRTNSEGISTLDVCVDAKGRVTSATIISGSGHAVLDNAALKWVRSARFTPGKLDGVPQLVCGHNVIYEWNLEDARK